MAVPLMSSPLPRVVAHLTQIEKTAIINFGCDLFRIDVYVLLSFWEWPLVATPACKWSDPCIGWGPIIALLNLVHLFKTILGLFIPPCRLPLNYQVVTRYIRRKLPGDLSFKATVISPGRVIKKSSRYILLAPNTHFGLFVFLLGSAEAIARTGLEIAH